MIKTVGELKAALKEYPDEAEVMMWDGEVITKLTIWKYFNDKLAGQVVINTASKEEAR